MAHDLFDGFDQEASEERAEEGFAKHSAIGWSLVFSYGVGSVVGVMRARCARAGGLAGVGHRRCFHSGQGFRSPPASDTGRVSGDWSIG